MSNNYYILSSPVKTMKRLNIFNFSSTFKSAALTLPLLPSFSIAWTLRSTRAALVSITIKKNMNAPRVAQGQTRGALQRDLSITNFHVPVFRKGKSLFVVVDSEAVSIPSDLKRINKSIAQLFDPRTKDKGKRFIYKFIRKLFPCVGFVSKTTS